MSGYPANLLSNDLVIDTSVAINLLATPYCSEILRSLPWRVVLTDFVRVEIGRGLADGDHALLHIDHLVEQKLVTLGGLKGHSLSTFQSLIDGNTANTLGDGEASALAFAHDHLCGVAIDERKARRICSERFAAIPMVSSVELLLHPEITRRLGRNGQRECLLQALTETRMRVLPEYSSAILELLGEEQARKCSSLRPFLREYDRRTSDSSSNRVLDRPSRILR